MYMYAKIDSWERSQGNLNLDKNDGFMQDFPWTNPLATVNSPSNLVVRKWGIPTSNGLP